MADLDNLLNEQRSREGEARTAPTSTSGKGSASDLSMNSPVEQKKLISNFLASKNSGGGTRAPPIAACNNTDTQYEAIRKRFQVKTLDETDICKGAADQDKVKEADASPPSTCSLKTLASAPPPSTCSLKTLASAPPEPSAAGPMEDVARKKSDLLRVEDLRKKLLSDLLAAGVDSKGAGGAKKRRKDSELGGGKEGVGQCHFGGRALFLMLFLLIPAVMLIVWLLVGLATSPVPYPLENIDVEADDLSLLVEEPSYALVEEFLEASKDSEITRLQLASAMEEASKDIQQIVASVSDEADSASLNIDVEEEVHLLKDIMSILSDTSIQNNADGSYGDDDEVSDGNSEDEASDVIKTDESIKGTLGEHDPHRPVDASDGVAIHPSQMKPIMLQFLYVNILRCRSRGDIVLAEYIRMYRLLNAFLSNFGSFAAVQTQMLEDRIRNLEIRHQGVNRQEYQTLSGMIRFEDAAGTVGDIDPVSGTIIFTCLQRHLQYLSLALHAIIPLPGDEPLLHPFESAYRTILASHHSWFVEKFYLVGLAMLPSKKQAVAHLKVSQGEDVSMDDLMASLRLIVRELDELTEATEVILETSGVLGRIPTQVVT